MTKPSSTPRTTRRWAGRAASVALAAGLVVASAPAAFAASSAVTSPRTNTDLTTSVRVTVDVTGVESDPLSGVEDIAVQARLSADGSSTMTGSVVVDLSCVSGCDETTQVWGGITLSPHTGAPFRNGGVCNGGHYLQTSVNGGAWNAGSRVVFQIAPKAATNVRVSTADGAVTVRWAPATEPDNVDQLVQRKTGSGAWKTVGTVASDATSHVDTPPVGTHSYRIVSQRPDGRVGGNAQRPCADTEADLLAFSDSVPVTVEAPEPEPTQEPTTEPSSEPTAEPTATPSNGPTSQPTSGPSPTSQPSNGPVNGPVDEPSDAPSQPASGGSSPSSSPSEQPSSGGGQAPAAGDPSASPSPSPSPSSSSGASRGRQISRPPSASSESRSVEAPQVAAPEPSSRETVYYGEGEGYGEIDFGDAEPIAGEPTTVTRSEATTRQVVEERRVARGSVWQSAGRTIVPERVAEPVAAGLVFMTAGLHVMRLRRRDDEFY